ncbi:phosphoadenosine phosphosulfate reductase family protein [Methylosinus sp. PW1]|uniref:phosphoadenosine phosphosulfate reductase domain-containing protein n=1 Tax=Methylosinus sp. PW1 TaxID=107636 RepID=UPI0018DE429E|nr:phosphoadenosine phosphosulfate reductase family protein [Methylosinus sp. PW1]
MATAIYDSSVDVLTAARKRLEFVFDNFREVHVSISGGKDSTVLAHLALIEARKRNRKVGLFFLDEEVVYESTVRQIEYLMELYPENTNRLWLQIPFCLTNAVSLTEGQLVAWEPGRHKDWMRPKKAYSIHAAPWDREKQTVGNKSKGFGFYDVIENWERCHSGVAYLVGMRATEHTNRWLAVVQHPVDVGGEMVHWATKNGANVNFNPLYDWQYWDVWKYIHQENLRYSRVYDWQFRKGTPFHQCRVSSLIHEKSFRSLCDLPEFEPKTYERLCERIKGISFASETGKASRMFGVSKLPKNYDSWRGYRDFLLATYPDAEKKGIFVKRFAKHLDNDYVARQQCRQLVLNDYENNLPIANKEDPRVALIQYYRENL